jgi:HEAT repeat protein
MTSRDDSVSNIADLISAFDNPEGSEREKARQALVAIGSRAVGLLIEALKSSNVWVREEAVKSLGQIGDITAVHPLIRLLEDESLEVRFRAAESLVVLGPNILPHILEALIERPGSLHLQEGVLLVLEHIPMEDLREASRVLSVLRENKPAEAVREAAEVLLNRLLDKEDSN